MFRWPGSGRERDGLGWYARLAWPITERLRRGGKATSMAQVVALRALALAVNICTGLLTAAVLGPSGRGELAALTVAPGFLGGLASLGLHGSLIYNLKADPAHERELLGNGIMLTLLTGCIVMVGGWIVEPYWLNLYSPHTIFIGRILLLSAPTVVMGWSMSGAVESRGWFGLVNSVLYLQSLATLALLGVLTLLHCLTPTVAAFAYTIPGVSCFGYLFFQVLRRMRPVFRPRLEMVRRLLRYGIRLCGVDILGTLSGVLDQLVIVAFLPAGMVGTYAVALSSARILTVVQSGVSTVLFPSIAARDVPTIVRTVAVAFRFASLLIAGIAAVLLLVGPPLLLLAYGTKFAPAIMPFRILLLAMVIENGARILHQIYAGCGRPELVTLFEGFAVAVLLLAMLALVPPLGTLGAALAVLCTASFRLVVAIGGLPLMLKIPLPRLVFGWDDLRLLRAMLAHPGAAPALAASPSALEGVP